MILGAWAEYAACAGKPSKWFFPESGAPSGEVVALCGGCPVKRECLNFAVATNQRYGIWGGVGLNGRKRVRRERVSA